MAGLTVALDCFGLLSAYRGGGVCCSSTGDAWLGDHGRVILGVGGCLAVDMRFVFDLRVLPIWEIRMKMGMEPDVTLLIQVEAFEE